jgi:hypothetical protein
MFIMDMSLCDNHELDSEHTAIKTLSPFNDACPDIHMAFDNEFLEQEHHDD